MALLSESDWEDIKLRMQRGQSYEMIASAYDMNRRTLRGYCELRGLKKQEVARNYLYSELCISKQQVTH